MSVIPRELAAFPNSPVAIMPMATLGEVLMLSRRLDVTKEKTLGPTLQQGSTTLLLARKTHLLAPLAPLAPISLDQKAILQPTQV